MAKQFGPKREKFYTNEVFYYYYWWTNFAWRYFWGKNGIPIVGIKGKDSTFLSS